MEAILNVIEEVQTTQKIDLIKGEFTASEATDVLHSVLNAKVNFHKLKCLSQTESDSTNPCVTDNERINELIHSRKQAKEFIAQAKALGKKFRIESSVQISLEE